MAENFQTGRIVECVITKRKPKVITLCGSTRFRSEYEEANRRLTLQGNIVLSVGLFGHADAIALTPEEKALLDEVHLRKIDLSDEVFVINVGGYIGQSTRREIEYAQSLSISVLYLEPMVEVRQMNTKTEQVAGHVVTNQ